MSQRPTYAELKKKLAEAETLITSLRVGEVDEIISERDAALLGIRELEEAYIESEQNFRNAMDICPVGIRIVTKDGELLYTNQAILDICGLGSFEELKAIPRQQLYTPESYAGHQERKERRKRGEFLTGDYEISIRRPDGEVRNLQVFRKEIIWGGESQFMSMYQDLTERKRLENIIEKERKEYGLIIDSSPIIIFYKDEKGKYVHVNKAFTEALNMPEEDLLGKTVFDLYSTDIAQGMTNDDNEVLESGCPKLNIIEQYESARGLRWVQTDKIPIFNENGIPVGLVGFAQDITERKQAEEALKAERDKAQQYLDIAGVVFICIDADQKVSLVNKKGCELLGRQESEIVGKNWFDNFIPDSIRDKIKGIFAKLIAGDIEPIEYYENTVLTGQGQERMIAWHNTLLRDAAGAIIGTLSSGEDITERKQAEEALRESEEKFFKAFRSSPDRIAITTLDDGRFVDVNDSYLRFTGFTREDVIGRSSVELGSWINPENRARIVERLKKQGHVENEEVTLRTKSGEIRTSLFSAEIINIKGEPCMISIATDITERKQAEEELLQSNERFQLTFETANIAICLVDLDGRFTMVNDQMCTMYGYPREELESMAIRDLTHPEDVSPRFIQRASSGEIDHERFIQRYIHKDGQILWGEVSSSIVRDARGNPLYFISYVLDITERKQAEERISNLNNMLHCIRNVNQLITREKDRDRLIKGVCDTLVESRSFNNAWIALLDDSRKPLTFAASGYSDNFSPMLELLKRGELPPCVQKAMSKEKVVVTRDPRSMCAACPLHPDSSGSCGITVRLDYEGNIYGILCASMPESMISDEDEILLFDEVATDIAFALHDMAFEAEHKLLEGEQLRSAKLESISTLAGGIAHDFNNLLTGIMGNIGLARTYSGSSKKASATLDEAEKAAVRARDLTQQLLTFARGGKPVKKIVNINELIKESATFALRGSAARLELSLPDDLWPVEIDEGQINQVIHNLVINADEAMPSGGILKIGGANSVLKEVSALPLPKGRYIRIDIQDAGIGISEAHLERIFEPYFTTKKKGSGLGLSSAYSIIKNHGGYIIAESAKSKGTTFHIYLPTSRKPTRMKREPKPESPVQAGGRILVMDDEEVIRKMLSNMLKLAGYKAELTSDGDEALEKYSQALESGKPFDAVIMDLTIPGGTGGKEAIKKLLKIDPGARVIVSSGYATDPIMSEYKKYGFSAVIAKPYSVRQLEETLRSLSKRKK